MIKQNNKKSDSTVQQEAEKIIFEEVKVELGTELQSNAKLFLDQVKYSYILPDFYSEEHKIIGEIFAHVGKPKPAQDKKIAYDILKMLLWERKANCKYKKIIVVCDDLEFKKLTGKSAIAESIREFGIEIMKVDIDRMYIENIKNAQERQKMVNKD